VSPTTIERMTAFDHRFSRAQATDVIDLEWGFALLQRDFPLSHYHNRIVVTSAVPATEILSTADTVLGGMGLRHRYVSVDDDSLGQHHSADFLAAGYEHSPIVSMAYSGNAAVGTHSHRVVAVSLATLRPAIIRQWRGELPTATDHELDQLADRTALYSRGADLTLLAVYDGSEIAAHADLYVDRAKRVAQFENLATHEPYRGRGYGTALVRDALRRSEEAGCDLAFLTVDRDDWPIEWYRRLGFAEAGQTHHFSRSD
jgi:ribosomal protein S18 acetylase RimI-like enzyme